MNLERANSDTENGVKNSKMSPEQNHTVQTVKDIF